MLGGEEFGGDRNQPQDNPPSLWLFLIPWAATTNLLPLVTEGVGDWEQRDEESFVHPIQTHSRLNNQPLCRSLPDSHHGHPTYCPLITGSNFPLFSLYYKTLPCFHLYAHRTYVCFCTLHTSFPSLSVGLLLVESHWLRVTPVVSPSLQRAQELLCCPCVLQSSRIERYSLNIAASQVRAQLRFEICLCFTHQRQNAPDPAIAGFLLVSALLHTNRVCPVTQNLWASHSLP